MRLRWGLAACGAVMVSGCASLDAMPRSVLPDATVDQMISNYRPDLVITTMGQIPTPEARNTYRNRVVMAYLTAIDARYTTFKRELSRTGKGGHLAADAVSLGLTGLAAVATGGASELASAATVVGGLRSSFDKEVLADKTFPVLISLMDSRRLSVRADILRGLAQDEGAYTIEEAFSDIMRYESAGNIDAAVEQAAAAAAQQAQAAQYDYDRAIELCTVDAATSQARLKLMGELQTVAVRTFGTDAAAADTARQQLQAAAAAAGAPQEAPATTRETALAQLVPVRDLVQTFCDTASINAFATKLKAAGVPVT
jgi:hypothetical protein